MNIMREDRLTPDHLRGRFSTRATLALSTHFHQGHRGVPVGLRRYQTNYLISVLL